MSMKGSLDSFYLFFLHIAMRCLKHFEYPEYRIAIEIFFFLVNGGEMERGQLNIPA